MKVIKRWNIILLATMAATTAQAEISVYTGLAGPQLQPADTSGIVGWDDYVSASPTESFALQRFFFAGGVSLSGGGLSIEFYRPDWSFFNSFELGLPRGHQNHQISFGDNSTVMVPRTGFILMRALGNNTAHWNLTTQAPVQGQNDFAVGTGAGLNPQRNQTFTLTAVPEPASMLVFGIGSLILVMAKGRKR